MQRPVCEMRAKSCAFDKPMPNTEATASPATIPTCSCLTASMPRYSSQTYPIMCLAAAAQSGHDSPSRRAIKKSKCLALEQYCSAHHRSLQLTHYQLPALAFRAQYNDWSLQWLLTLMRSSTRTPSFALFARPISLLDSVKDTMLCSGST